MTTLREAAQQALEALHVVLKDDYRLPYEKIVAATDALNVALAEPVQEPWVCACGANLYIDAEGKPRSKA